MQEERGAPLLGKSDLHEDDSDFGDSLLEMMDSTAPWLPIPVAGEWLGGPQGRRFKIEQALGSGSMGMVYRAWDAALQRVVALKFLQSRAGPLKRGAIELLEQEARAVAQLNHENIVHLFDVAEWIVEPGGLRVPFLVMEHLEGESLAALLGRGRPGMKRTMEIMESIAAGLAHAHRRHLVHRDLKPANVFLTQEGTVKLLDFGLAHLMASASAVPFRPIAGTPAYMSPEQWRGEPQDARVDVWAAGVILYELLSGVLPYTELSSEKIRAQVLSPELLPSVRERCPELPWDVEPLLASVLAKDPARRLPSGQELLEQLRELSEHLGLHRKPVRFFSPQRRQVTLVCCVPVGIPESLEPDDRDELEAAFQEGYAEILGRCGGSVMLSMGAQVLACFGYPHAREEDSKSAVQAGMLLIQGFPQWLQQKLPRPLPPDLSVRIGVHTDRVALHESRGEPGSGALVIAGDALERVTWLARQAEPGAVLLSEATQTLVRGAFELEALEVPSPTGLPASGPVRVFQVLSERKTVSRFDRTRAAFGLTPLVGREEELRELLGLREQARQGQGAAILLCGEAGLGKSRLIHEVHTRSGVEATRHLSAQCGAQFTASALHPVIELLQRLLREALPEGISPCSVRRLEPRLRALGLSDEHLQALASLLSLPPIEGVPTLQLTPEHQKLLVFDALALLLRGLAFERPVLAVVEDLHWADPSTLELLVWLLEPVMQSRVLLLLSTRPELRYPILREHGVHVLKMERLPEEQTETLVWEAARGRALAPELVRQLVKRTEGVPLFVEEITRMVLERQAAGDLHASIPLSLNELLLARLDMLPPRQKTLAQLCAVVGRRFSSTLVSALARLPEPAAARELEGLAAVGILQEEGQDAGAAEYQFRHALIQEAAGQSLLRATRREYHQRIAKVVVGRFPEMAESHPELLAHHYTEAGLSAQAVSWWARAGEQASLRSANQEAIGHFTQALKLLRGLPDASQRKGEELQLLLMLGVPLVQVQGYRSTEAEQTYARAQVLIHEVGEALPRLELSCWGHFSFYFARGELHLAQALAEQLVALGQRYQSREMMALGYRGLALVTQTYGQLRAARAHVEHALECSDFTLEEHKSLAREQLVDPRVAALSYGSIVLCLMDELEKARCWRHDALELAGRIGHPHNSAFALHYAAMGCQFQGDAASTLELAEHCLALSREHHFRLWLGWSALLRSWALAGLGRAQEGLSLMKQGSEAWQSSGIQAGQQHHNLGMLAEVQLWCDQPRQALEVLERALSHLGAERFYESELHRLRGESLRALGREQEAVASLLRAMEVARQQGALLFERRARQKLGQSPLFLPPAEPVPTV